MKWHERGEQDTSIPGFIVVLLFCILPTVNNETTDFIVRFVAHFLVLCFFSICLRAFTLVNVTRSTSVCKMYSLMRSANVRELLKHRDQSWTERRMCNRELNLNVKPMFTLKFQILLNQSHATTQRSSVASNWHDRKKIDHDTNLTDLSIGSQTDDVKGRSSTVSVI